MTRHALHILYNGACPICAREIAHYRRLADRSGAALVFEDLNATDLGRWDLTPEAARRRLHARLGNRRLDGLEAFRALWARLPGWRWVARVTGLPLVRQITALVYDRIAAPLLARRQCGVRDCRIRAAR